MSMLSIHIVHIYIIIYIYTVLFIILSISRKCTSPRGDQLRSQILPSELKLDQQFAAEFQVADDTWSGGSTGSRAGPCEEKCEAQHVLLGAHL